MNGDESSDEASEFGESPDFTVKQAIRMDQGYRGLLSIYHHINTTEEGKSSAVTFVAIRLKKIEIGSGKINGIVLQALEKRMQDIDWRNLLYEPDKKLSDIEGVVNVINFKKAGYVLQDLETLKSAGLSGSEVAEKLEAKYFLDSPFRERLADRREYFEEKYKDRFEIDNTHFQILGAKEVYNIFEGRAVLNRPRVESNSMNPEANARWLQMDDYGRLKVIPHNSSFDLQNQIVSMPIAEVVGFTPVENIMQSLEKGDPVLVSWVDAAASEKVNLYVDPQHEIIGRNTIESFREELKVYAEIRNEIPPVDVAATENLHEEIKRLEKITTDRGLDPAVIARMKEVVESGNTDFVLSYYENGIEDEYDVEIGFSPDPDTGRIGIPGFLVTLYPQDDSETRIRQFFKSAFDQSFTIQEALNLINQRVVFKSPGGENNDAGKQAFYLDYSRRDETGNFQIASVQNPWEFNIAQKIDELSISNMQYPALKEKLIRSLENGNLNRITITGEHLPLKILGIARTEEELILKDYNRSRYLGQESGPFTEGPDSDDNEHNRKFRR